MTILLTNQTTPGHSIETEQLKITLDNAREPVAAHIWRIDAEHANPKRLWEEMGRPERFEPEGRRAVAGSLTSQERTTVEQLQRSEDLAENRSASARGGSDNY